jgi:hypothetical protein
MLLTRARRAARVRMRAWVVHTPVVTGRTGGGTLLQFGSGQVKAKELCFGSDGATMER